MSFFENLFHCLVIVAVNVAGVAAIATSTSVACASGVADVANTAGIPGV